MGGPKGVLSRGPSVHKELVQWSCMAPGLFHPSHRPGLLGGLNRRRPGPAEAHQPSVAMPVTRPRQELAYFHVCRPTGSAIPLIASRPPDQGDRSARRRPDGPTTFTTPVTAIHSGPCTFHHCGSLSNWERARDAVTAGGVPVLSTGTLTIGLSPGLCL